MASEPERDRGARALNWAVVAQSLYFIVILSCILASLVIVTELSSRIGARHFFTEQLRATREEAAVLSAKLLATDLEARTKDDLDRHNELTVEGSELRIRHRQIEGLAFSGAYNASRTAHALYEGYEAIFRARDLRTQKAGLAEATRSASDLMRRYDVAIDEVKNIIEAGRNHIGRDVDFQTQDETMRRLLGRLDGFVESQNPTFSALVAITDRFRPPANKGSVAQSLAPFLEELTAAVKDFSSAKDRVQLDIDEFKRRFKLVDEQLTPLEQLIGTGGSSGGGIGKEWANKAIFAPLRAIWLAPSDLLEGLLMIFSAVVGSAFLAIAKNHTPQKRWTYLSKGLIAGFAAFVIIKGGKDLFLVQLGAGAIPVNPYASAFAGILAGLFSDRAYEVLEKLFNTSADRITEAAATDTQQPAPPKPAQSVTPPRKTPGGA